MSATYALKIHIWSYDYEDTFYFVGKDCETIADVLTDVAADHIAALTNPETNPRQYWLDALRNDVSDGEDAYKQANPDIECSVTVDVQYHRATVCYDNCEFELGRQPNQTKIADLADALAAGEYDAYPHLKRNVETLDFREETDATE